MGTAAEDDGLTDMSQLSFFVNITLKFDPNLMALAPYMILFSDLRDLFGNFKWHLLVIIYRSVGEIFVKIYWNLGRRLEIKIKAQYVGFIFIIKIGGRPRREI